MKNQLHTQTSIASQNRSYHKPTIEPMGRLSEVTLIPSALAGTCAIGTYDPSTGTCR